MLNTAPKTASALALAALLGFGAASATGQRAEVDWEEFARIRLGESLSAQAAANPNPRDPVPDTPAREQPGALPPSETPPAGRPPIEPPSGGPPAGLPGGSGNEPGAAVELSQPIIYSRVPRTRGRHEVALRDGTPYTVESPDVWDTLPDSRMVFEGFNAPGQLVLRQPDGFERVIFDCFANREPCVPLDPAVSLDGRKVVFSVYRGSGFKSAWWDGTTLPNQRLAGAKEAQLYMADIASGEVTPLAHSPGVFDVSPTWLPDGRIMFASTRANTEQPYLQNITPNDRKEPQIFIAGADGKGAVNVTPHEVSTAMHPYLLQSGRVAYSSQWLSHNLAYGSTNGGVNWPGTLDNMWLVMDMTAAGGDMTALLGAHRGDVNANGRRKTMKALHFLGQRHNGDICVANYYRANNLGLGDVFCWEPEEVGVEGSMPGFLPRKLYDVAYWAQSNDSPSFKDGDLYLGKIGYPEGIANDQLLLTVGRGFCTQVSGSVQSFQDRVAQQPEKRGCDAGLYATTRIPSRSMSDLALVVDHEDWHEFGARVVAARSVGNPAPSTTGNGSCQLASSDAGTAETSPHRPYEFNDNYRTTANNGGEIDGLQHRELAGIRFWQVLPNRSDKRSFTNATGNQLQLLGDVPLMSDNSFKVELPCDVPYLMAGIDQNGLVIKRDQVPQSLRPDEKRVCTGCHLHSRPGRPYSKSLAFHAPAITLLTPRPVPSYERDIKPILQARCQSCHSDDLPLMDYNKLVWEPFQEAVPEAKRLQVRKSDNPRRQYGLQRPYTSKYVNSMFARESLLFWKAANARTDGRRDSTYPDDIDFGADHPTTITAGELEVLGAWLDSGATSLEAN